MRTAQPTADQHRRWRRSLVGLVLGAGMGAIAGCGDSPQRLAGTFDLPDAKAKPAPGKPTPTPATGPQR